MKCWFQNSNGGKKVTVLALSYKSPKMGHKVALYKGVAPLNGGIVEIPHFLYQKVASSEAL